MPAACCGSGPAACRGCPSSASTAETVCCGRRLSSAPFWDAPRSPGLLPAAAARASAAALLPPSAVTLSASPPSAARAVASAASRCCAASALRLANRGRGSLPLVAPACVSSHACKRSRAYSAATSGRRCLRCARARSAADATGPLAPDAAGSRVPAWRAWPATCASGAATGRQPVRAAEPASTGAAAWPAEPSCCCTMSVC